MGNTWYVRISAPAAGNGRTPDTAFNTIRAATGVAERGDTVYIGPGVYANDPLILRKAGIRGAYILWVGDPFGDKTGDPAGPVQIPYFDVGYGDSRYNGMWFIDFYDKRPNYGSTVVANGGMSARITLNENILVTDAPIDPAYRNNTNKFCGLYFVSCKFAGQVQIINRSLDHPDTFFRQAFRSCVIGYSFPAGTDTRPTIYYYSYAPFVGYGGNKRQKSGLVSFYGCTIKAAANLLGSTPLIDCANNRADALPSPPNPPGTPKYSLAMTFVNCILDSTHPSHSSNKQIFGYIVKESTTSFAVQLSGDYNVFRVRNGAGNFSNDFATLALWQTGSIVEKGNVHVYLDPADDKIKFYLETDSIFVPGTGNYGGGNQTVTHPTPLSIDTWYHCAASWDKSTGTMKLNIDGTTTTQTLQGMLFDEGNMGSYGGSFYMDRGFRGLMDEVRIWNEARLDADVNTYKSVELIPDDHPELYRYYKLNEGTGTSAIDTPNSTNVDALPPRDADLVNISYSADVPFGSGYSIVCGLGSAVLMGTRFPVDSPVETIASTNGTFTFECWFKITTLASVVGQNMILVTKGSTRSDGNSFYKSHTDDLFTADGWHLEAGSSPIDMGCPIFELINWGYSGDFDAEGDPRPYGEHVDIGADEYYPQNDPDHSVPYGFTSKVYGFIQDGLYPSRYMCDFQYNQDITPEGTDVCGNIAPVGGWKDHLRILISFKPAETGKWIEILNTETGVDMRGDKIIMPNTFRGPHFRVKFEIYPHAQHLNKFDLGMTSEEASTQAITQDDVAYEYPPGCELDVYNYMFKELVARTIVKRDGSWSVMVWPGTYFIKPHGQTAAMDQGREFVTVGFSDWFAPFGGTNCAIPYQVDWAEFENEFMGIDWASWYANEQFIDEAKRISTELPDGWPYEQYSKRALVRCGRLIKGASWISGFRLFADPSLNIEGYESLNIWDYFNVFIPWGYQSANEDRPPAEVPLQ